MPSAYTNLTYHIVFGTKRRQRLLDESVRTDTYKYISGIITNKGGKLLEIGGVEDHVHILTSCPARIAVSEFVRDIKANSSRWLCERQNGFAWQIGYSAFSVSASQVDRVRAYIQQQAEHHATWSFADELMSILRRHGIAFDPQRLFEDDHHA